MCAVLVATGSPEATCQWGDTRAAGPGDESLPTSEKKHLLSYYILLMPPEPVTGCGAEGDSSPAGARAWEGRSQHLGGEHQLHGSAERDLCGGQMEPPSWLKCSRSEWGQDHVGAAVTLPGRGPPEPSSRKGCWRDSQTRAVALTSWDSLGPRLGASGPENGKGAASGR